MSESGFSPVLPSTHRYRQTADCELREARPAVTCRGIPRTRRWRGGGTVPHYNRCGTSLLTRQQHRGVERIGYRTVSRSQKMVPHIAVFSLVMFSMLAGTPAQRSPYLGSSDPGVLPQYLPEGTADRFGGNTEAAEPPKLHAGTLESEAVYNRVSQWPDAHKPYWYLNAVAIQKQREQQQQQAEAQAAAQQAPTRSPFASSTTGRLARQNN